MRESLLTSAAMVDDWTPPAPSETITFGGRFTTDGFREGDIVAITTDRDRPRWAVWWERLRTFTWGVPLTEPVTIERQVTAVSSRKQMQVG